MTANNGILTLIALALLGILTFLALDYQERQKSPTEKISDGIHDMKRDIEKSIDDATK